MRETDQLAGAKPSIWRLEDFGARADSGEDTVSAMRRAIAAAAGAGGPALLTCGPGRYDFYPEEAARVPYFITNTASETENPDITKTIGIYMKGVRDLTLDGQGALFVFHGKQTMLVLDGCERISIRHVHMDYAEPTVTEAMVTGVGDDWIELEIHPDSRCVVEDGKLYWIGEGWRFHEGPVQAYDPARDTTWRIDNPVEAATTAALIGPRGVRLNFGEARSAEKALAGIEAGFVLQFRDGIRDQVGAFLLDSRDVVMDGVGMHFMHGLGIVGQYSKNLTFVRMAIEPRPETGRTVAAFADCIHLMGCRGRIEIADSRFAGAHDDAINVHGTYLQIVGRPAPDTVEVRFMHPQSYGFEAFRTGDEIEFARSRSLVAFGIGRVRSVERVDDRTLRLTLEEPAPAAADVEPGDVVENVTWTPEVRIAGNRFARIPTRGILITTRRKVTIEDNTFERMRMSAILIEGDASSWFESGPVRDLTIRNNRFVECGDAEFPVIAITPAVDEPDAARPVHRDIRIEGNRFETREALALKAKGAAGVSFTDNEIRASAVTGDGFGASSVSGALCSFSELSSFSGIEETIRLSACADTDVRDNRFIFSEE
ncbi:right-handed parallel beta-helix repeat-containing protein [Cohnella hashimotonis]|uniref:Right-handed parallel beta-helix repeat-containing protein n=1 Tax=Cohnella hashimotonis TaxID=2826895 RepID=A0ABT6TBT2_9BACL|nr:right-handed parallel beta-helix repeat-containing protein [Cohnella hashimotonis]MDI4644291.1 right-handed parallel beta-helix repeat-containing protein [Cohnella hashimotonis]